MTPLSGWLAGRFGRKRILLFSITGFIVTSALCGAAQSLPQIVIFRLLQGAFGACMLPLAQAVILDTYSLEERGPMMAIWGMGVMVAPIIGPVLGGWLTDDFSWRWVFYINLPIGVLSLLGVMTFIHEQKHERKVPLDVMGFPLLSVAIASVQLFLDRGQNNDWFQSTEILIEATVAGLSFVLFVIHTFTAKRPFLPVELLADRNFVTASLIGFAIGLLIFSVLALLPPLAETLLGYPVITTGLVIAPRGVGSIISIYLAGRLVGRVDTRLLIISGLTMFAIAFYGMSHYSTQMGPLSIVWTGVVQGLGTGLVFIPMTTLAFATLDPSLRPDGTGVFTLVRNLGSSAGISVMQALFTRNSTIVHARLVETLRPDNPLARAPYLAVPFSLTAPSGIAALNAEVNRQASMVAYVDVFHLMFVVTVVMIPMVLLLRKPNDQIVDTETMLEI
jgi:DHA2 family multidrug resistance protein